MIISRSSFLKLKIRNDSWSKSMNFGYPFDKPIGIICVSAWCIKQNSCLSDSVIPIPACKNCDFCRNFSENTLDSDLLQYIHKLSLVIDSLIIGKFCGVRVDEENAGVNETEEDVEGRNVEVEINEDIGTDENIELDEDTEADEGVWADKSVEVDEGIEVDENVEVDEDVKVDESAEADGVGISVNGDVEGMNESNWFSSKINRLLLILKYNSNIMKFITYQ